MNSVSYIGAAYGNLAWLDYRVGNITKAELQAKEALAIWGDYQYPFKWLAHWVLIAIYLDRDEIAQAIESVCALLDEKQQRLPDDVTATLEKAVGNWEAGWIDVTRMGLTEVVEKAQEWGYL